MLVGRANKGIDAFAGGCVENAYRDVNIAFANELSMICDKADINVNELIDLASKHPRVRILKPGPGVGGHCIAVDPWFIVSEFPTEAKIIKQARLINNYKREWVMKKIKASAKKFQKDKGRIPMIACMGLSYKQDIDDLRESPALEIYHELEADKFAGGILFRLGATLEEAQAGVNTFSLASDSKTHPPKRARLNWSNHADHPRLAQPHH